VPPGVRAALARGVALLIENKNLFEFLDRPDAEIERRDCVRVAGENHSRMSPGNKAWVGPVSQPAGIHRADRPWGHDADRSYRRIGESSVLIKIPLSRPTLRWIPTQV
jgi:hypothetical protein